jgi:hypothetical protein
VGSAEPDGLKASRPRGGGHNAIREGVRLRHQRFVTKVRADCRRYISSGEISETAAGKTERTARRIYTTIYELDSLDAIATSEFRAMRGWYQFAPHVRSRTQVIVPV